MTGATVARMQCQPAVDLRRAQYDGVAAEASRNSGDR
jgi:hypothetical protein